MCGHTKPAQAHLYRDFLTEIDPIKLKEPLAETLGAFVDTDVVLEYTYLDVIKLAGHSCPTTAVSFLCCQLALDKLYPDEIPVRGNIAVTVYGEPDDGVYGVISQIFTFITGAAPPTGFKGLGPKFKRKDLLTFSTVKIDTQSLCFKFKRIDTNVAVLVKYFPQNVPYPVEKGVKLNHLMEQIVWDAANENEKTEFQNLWMEKVRIIIEEKKCIDQWLKIEFAGG